MGSLVDLLALDHIVVGARERTSEQIIRSLTALLVRSGNVQDGYAEACLRREATDPTGLPTAGAAVAIPHADPDLVTRAGFALGIPVQPIVFKQMGDPDVEVAASAVFLLALSGPGEQLSALREVAAFVQDPTRLQALVAATDAEEVRDLLASHDQEISS